MTMVMTIVVMPDLAKFEGLSLEAISEFEVVNMPVTAAVDSAGRVGASGRAGGMEDEDCGVEA